MTFRAIIIGFCLSVLLCSVTYFNQSVMRQTALVANYLPVSIYGSLILVILILNPLLGRMRSSWRLKTPEMALVLIMVLSACGIAESGFLKTFTNVLMLPHHHVKTNPQWRDEGIFQRVPESMLAQPGEDEEALNQFVTGRDGRAPMTVSDVPWANWDQALLTWLPFVLVLTFGFMGLALVVHRQWAKHEQLSFPIAAFTRSLWKQDETGKVVLLKERPFWIAAGTVLFIHLYNFMHVWWPEYSIAIPLSFDFWSIGKEIPFFNKGSMGHLLSQLRIYFSVVGFAYLVSGDVSRSFAVAPFIYCFGTGVLAEYGINPRKGGEHQASIYTSLNLGSFVAFALMICWIGRRHYLAVTKNALRLRASEKSEAYEIWGMRVFIICVTLSTLFMIGHGLAWPFALIYMFAVIVFYLCISRVVVETGLFFMKPAWVPHILLLGLFGSYALGPTAMVLSMLFSSIMFAEARETVMPYVTNAIDFVKKEKLNPGACVSLAAAAVCLGLLAGIVATLVIQYDRGTDWDAGRWFTWQVPTYPVNITTERSRRLKSQARFEESDNLGTFERLAAIDPEDTFWISFVVGAVIVIVCYLGRLRFRGWPIHPAVFLLWSWVHVGKLTFSFFLGWLTKVLILKYGGAKMAQQAKVVMIGLIVGDMLGALVPSIISAVYFLSTGDQPPKFAIMP